MIDLRLIIYRSRKKKSNNYVISVTWLVQHAHRSNLLLVAGYVRHTFVLIFLWELGSYSSFFGLLLKHASLNHILIGLDAPMSIWQSSYPIR